MSIKFPTTRGTGGRAVRLALVVCLAVVAFCSVSSAQQRRRSRSLTSEDLLENRSAAESASASARTASTAESAITSYRDPSGAFSLTLPDSGWHSASRSQRQVKSSDRHIFRKLDEDGRAAATASVYVLTAAAGRSLIEASRLDAAAQRTAAASLARQYLSSNASVVSVNSIEPDSAGGFQIVADQTLSGRVVVRALISAFEHGGRVFIVVCRAPRESFDAEALEFSSITQSLASSVASAS